WSDSLRRESASVALHDSCTIPPPPGTDTAEARKLWMTGASMATHSEGSPSHSHPSTIAQSTHPPLAALSPSSQPSSSSITPSPQRSPSAFPGSQVPSPAGSMLQSAQVPSCPQVWVPVPQVPCAPSSVQERVVSGSQSNDEVSSSGAVEASCSSVSVPKVPVSVF